MLHLLSTLQGECRQEVRQFSAISLKPSHPNRRMDFSSALPTFVITLREGVEATLVVGIVLAYLKKAKQTYLNSWVFGGVLSGLGVSALVGFLFSWIVQAVGSANQ